MECRSIKNGFDVKLKGMEQQQNSCKLNKLTVRHHDKRVMHPLAATSPKQARQQC